MNLDFNSGLSLLGEIKKQKIKQDDWDLYCSMYPHFDEKTFIGFDVFCEQRHPTLSKQSAEEIYADVAEIRKKQGWK